MKQFEIIGFRFYCHSNTQFNTLTCKCKLIPTNRHIKLFMFTITLNIFNNKIDGHAFSDGYQISAFLLEFFLFQV